jgi:hypothetical protein
MIAPASIGDWVLFAGMLGALSALATVGYRWTAVAAQEGTHLTTARPAR